jgi:hypothetical protein
MLPIPARPRAAHLIDRWDRERIAASNPDASRIILTHTNDEVKALNEAARDRLRVHGALGGDVPLKSRARRPDLCRE